MSYLDRSIQAIQGIDAFLFRALQGQAWDPKPLLQRLSTVHEIYREQLQLLSVSQVHRSPGSSNPSFVVAESCSEATVSTASAKMNEAAVENDLTSNHEQNSHREEVREPLAIRSRADALTALDNICKYFEIHEPASPVPLLLGRAKRLIPMSFVDILRELAPGELPTLLQQFMGQKESKS